MWLKRNGGFFMFDIVGYVENDKAMILDFLDKLDIAITSVVVNNSILENAILIKKDGALCGMVSFEQLERAAVVRYFVYDGATPHDAIIGMFFELYKRAKSCGVLQLVVAVPNDQVALLFELLGFIHIKESIPASVANALGTEGRVMGITL